ncbi:MAG: TIGR02452 family protein [Polyangiales bacterium]
MGLTDPRAVSRSQAAAWGAEAVRIAREGRYTAPSGREVDLSAHIDRAVEGTFSVPHDVRIPLPPRGIYDTRVRATNETTLAAARRMSAAGAAVTALNFASARNPGGGFLTGARAQEESLCRASTLYACIAGAPMYAHHARLRDPLYTSWMLYSPSVPVFRDDDGALRERPWRCSFVTAAAPNAKVVLGRDPSRRDAVLAAIAERIPRVLALCAREGDTHLVLGAWGCGAFGGDSERVAQCFAQSLCGDFRGVFVEVVFAVLDSSPEQRFLGPFARRFGGPEGRSIPAAG